MSGSEIVIQHCFSCNWLYNIACVMTCSHPSARPFVFPMWRVISCGRVGWVRIYLFKLSVLPP